MRGWGGDRRSADYGQGAAERDWRKAQRVPRQPVRRRVLEVGGRRYVAYSAHDLIASEDDTARPGHPA